MEDEGFKMQPYGEFDADIRKKAEEGSEAPAQISQGLTPAEQARAFVDRAKVLDPGVTEQVVLHEAEASDADARANAARQLVDKAFQVDPDTTHQLLAQNEENQEEVA